MVSPDTGTGVRMGARTGVRAGVSGVPVLLTLAGHDVHVDTADTERTYRRTLGGGALTVERCPDATHSLLKQSIEQSDAKTTLTALFSPRSLFAAGFLDDQRHFLNGLGRGTGGISRPPFDEGVRAFKPVHATLGERMGSHRYMTTGTPAPSALHTAVSESL
ncbi:hypothetical protein [Streptomyces paromomycinus]|uniref:Alpha/beta hydrolase n=1 Tax=Streptomyces paromomycinus TaxID=92743 RepID=A0A401VUI4_STREY|nr:hypothetical protein [Streptomyces paromomycinus]GCD40716.1 hypothetical protein GKJPGBOP_00369 [Streptomyces paromomycinus]